MTNIYALDSSNYDPILLRLIVSVQRAADQQGVSIFMIGATARDILMTTFYNAIQQRATNDVDFAVCVGDWESFQKLKQSLIDCGFKEGNEAQRLVSPDKIIVDVVPFGNLSIDGMIIWPPRNDDEMSIVGFAEANEAALVVSLPESNQQIKVASPVGIALLKLIAWMDRVSQTARRKDAEDLLFLATNYQLLPAIEARAYSEGVMERFDNELTLAGAFLLGVDTMVLASKEAMTAIQELLERPHADSGIERLKEEAIPVRVSVSNSSGKQTKVLDAFEAGLKERIKLA